MARVETIGNATLYLGDCREILPTIGKFDAVVTDPPYGVGLTAKQNKWVKNEGAGYSSIDDTADFIKASCIPAIEFCLANARNTIVTPGTRNAFLYPTPDVIGGIFNPNGAGSGRWGFECLAPVLFYGKDPYLATGQGRRPNSWEQPANDYAEKNGHPCPKPIGMMRWIVQRGSLPNEIVVDPFMGSGTTGVAAIRLGRKFIGIEIDITYFEIACRRILLAVSTPDMFIDLPKEKQQSFQLGKVK